MIKVLCIIDNKHYLYGSINKGSIVLAYQVDINDSNSFIGVYINEKYNSYMGTRNKKCFIPLEEWRNQQIDKILNND